MMKKINWKNLSLLVIDFILVGYILLTLTSVMRGEFIGIEGFMKMVLVSIIAEPCTEELVRIVNK